MIKEFEPKIAFLQKYKLYVLIMLIFSGLIPRVLLLLSENALISVVIDDAFYYFKTAQNIFFHHSSSFDLINVTNGYQPLWMVLLLPLAAMIKTPWVFVKLAVCVNILLDLCVGLVLYRIIAKRSHLWYLPLIGFAVYFFNPAVIRASVNGMETTLSSLLFVWLPSLTILRDTSPSELKWHRFLLGIAAGLLFLARTDNVFYIAVFILIAVFEESTIKSRFKTFLIIVSTAFVVACPWLIFSYFEFGSIVQISGIALPYTLHEAFLAEGHSTSDVLKNSLHIFNRYITSGLYRTPLGFTPFVFWVWILSIVTIMVMRWKITEDLGCGLTVKTTNALRRIFKILVGLCVAACMLIFVHSFIRWYPRAYYFVQIIILLAIGTSFSITHLSPKIRGMRAFAERKKYLKYAFVLLLLAACLCGSLLVNTTLRYGRGRGPHQKDMLKAAEWLRLNSGQDEIACGFNVGIIGFFSERRVVNLDAAINNNAFEAIQNRNLINYINSVSAHYFIDSPHMFDSYKIFWGMPLEKLPMEMIVELNSNKISSVQIHRFVDRKEKI